MGQEHFLPAAQHGNKQQGAGLSRSATQGGYSEHLEPVQKQTETCSWARDTTGLRHLPCIWPTLAWSLEPLWPQEQEWPPDYQWRWSKTSQVLFPESQYCQEQLSNSESETNPKDVLWATLPQKQILRPSGLHQDFQGTMWYWGLNSSRMHGICMCFNHCTISQSLPLTLKKRRPGLER